MLLQCPPPPNQSGVSQLRKSGLHSLPRTFEECSHPLIGRKSETFVLHLHVVVISPTQSSISILLKMQVLQFKLSIMLESSLEKITMALLVPVGITDLVVVDRLVKEVMMLEKAEGLILRIVEDLEEAGEEEEGDLLLAVVQLEHSPTEEADLDRPLPDVVVVVVEVLPFLLITKKAPPMPTTPLPSGKTMINLLCQRGLFRQL